MSEAEKYLTTPRIRLLKQFAGRVKKFGLGVAVYDSDEKCVFNSAAQDDNGNTETSPDKSKGWQVPECNGELKKIVKELLKQETGSLYQDEKFTAINFSVNGSVRLGFVGILYPDGNSSLDNSAGSRKFYAQMLSMFTERLKDNFKTEEQLETVGDELSSAYEQLVLLNDISTNMKVTQSDSSFLQCACDRLTDIVNVEGIAVLLNKKTKREEKLEVTAGSGVIEIDRHFSSMLYERLTEQLERGKPALTDSDVNSPFEYKWPANIKSIIAVPLSGRERSGKRDEASWESASGQILGIMVAVNTIEKDDFDSTDIKLFTSVANACAVFVENIHLFDELKVLFLGSLKSLTSSIDAKDKYTHGHSERVALISRWIAERIIKEYNLPGKYVYRVYLAGLMHDIGKIGVDESVLRKEGKLTEEEYDAMKKHTSIGAEILGGIKQMQGIVDGVLSHHERVDGGGYPDGLKGDRIPLIAKIVCLADSFDAMTSRRSYRRAMTLEQALKEIEDNIGTQFDEKVGTTFLESDVYRLWNIIQQGYDSNYTEDNYRDYENLAVETLVQ